MSEEKKIPDSWVETTLSKVAEIGSSKRIFFSDYVSEGVPFYRSKEIIEKQKGNNISLDLFITEEKFNEIDSQFGSPKQYDILLTSVGTIGIPYIVKENEKFYFKDGNLTWFKNYKKIHPLFLYHWLLSSIGIESLKKITIGSTQSALTIAGLRTIQILLPNIEEQKSIAAILTAFDNKIELLQAQNKTLEETAQTIFEEWFGKYSVDDELPKGWKVGQIGDLIEIRRGSSPRPIQDFISNSGYKWLKISDATATDSPYIFEIKEHIIIEGLKNTTLKKAGDLVLSNSATPGMPKILAIETCVHDGWMHFPSSKVSNEYLYLLFLSIRPALVQQGSGSVFTNLKTDILREFDVIISTKDYYDEFDELIIPIFKKIYNNALQIQSLTKTRDELLPRLMSGEIRVNEFKV
jgi:type I restriction enzyme, S subunit